MKSDVQRPVELDVELVAVAGKRCEAGEFPQMEAEINEWLSGRISASRGELCRIRHAGESPAAWPFSLLRDQIDRDYALLAHILPDGAQRLDFVVIGRQFGGGAGGEAGTS